jgi:hypothetical protein
MKPTISVFIFATIYSLKSSKLSLLLMLDLVGAASIRMNKLDNEDDKLYFYRHLLQARFQFDDFYRLNLYS